MRQPGSALSKKSVGSRDSSDYDEEQEENGFGGKQEEEDADGLWRVA